MKSLWNDSFIDTLHQSVAAIVSKPLRSSLTVLGIVIGNASFIAMVGIGQGTKGFLIEKLESFGPNRLILYSSQPPNTPVDAKQNSITLDDAEAIAKGAPAVKAIAPQLSGKVLLSNANKSTRLQAVGTTFDYPIVSNSRVKTGRFFLPSEQSRNDAVIVLGPSTAARLFGSESAVGRQIFVNKVRFTVIGVMAEKGSFAQFNPDASAFLPITTQANRVLGVKSPQGIPVEYVDVTAVNREAIKDAEFQIRNILLWRHKQEDFTIQSNQPFLTLIVQVTTALTAFLAVIASISLVVGGIGIMNVMLVTVSERTQEIGLKKAIGAKNSVILMQFLIESVILSALGGGLGILIGLGGTITISLLSPFRAPVPSWAVVVSLGISTGVGIIFGISPAQRAARMDPIQALRSD